METPQALNEEFEAFKVTKFENFTSIVYTCWGIYIHFQLHEGDVVETKEGLVLIPHSRPYFTNVRFLEPTDKFPEPYPKISEKLRTSFRSIAFSRKL